MDGGCSASSRQYDFIRRLTASRVQALVSSNIMEIRAKSEILIEDEDYTKYTLVMTEAIGSNLKKYSAGSRCHFRKYENLSVIFKG